MRSVLVSLMSCLLLLIFSHGSLAETFNLFKQIDKTVKELVNEESDAANLPNGDTANLPNGEAYYYANTYFSKVNVPSLGCPSGANTVKNSGNIICKKKCESGFTQIGDTCEPNRGKRKVKEAILVCKKKTLGICVKTGYECRDGYERKNIADIAPVCLSPCPSNMRGTEIASVPHCVTSKDRYAVISLKTELTCKDGFKLNAVGICVEKCRSNYKPISETNICFMKEAPTGYSFCGINSVKSPGFARGFDLEFGDTKVRVPAKQNCQMMTAGQIYSVTSLWSAANQVACPTCKAQREANKAALLETYADNLEDAKSMGPELLENLDPLSRKIFNVIDEGGSVKSINFLKEVNLVALEQIMDGAKKVGIFTAKKGRKIPAFYKLATESDPNSYEGQLEMVRNAATIAGIFLAIPSIASGGAYPAIDLLGASMDTIAAFSYPVWGKG